MLFAAAHETAFGTTRKPLRVPMNSAHRGAADPLCSRGVRPSAAVVPRLPDTDNEARWACSASSMSRRAGKYCRQRGLQPFIAHETALPQPAFEGFVIDDHRPVIVLQFTTPPKLVKVPPRGSLGRVERIISLIGRATQANLVGELAIRAYREVQDGERRQFSSEHLAPSAYRVIALLHLDVCKPTVADLGANRFTEGSQ